MSPIVSLAFAFAIIIVVGGGAAFIHDWIVSRQEREEA